MEDCKKDVKRYEPNPDMAAIERLHKHLRLAMADDDAKWVAIHQPHEVETAAAWLHKHLGCGEAEAKKIVETVGKEMHADRYKNRVTFYYLAAKKLGKLEALHSLTI